MKLCDVTLREGDQMPGRSYGVDDRLEAGRTLDRLGVDLIEAGFPATGAADRRVVDELSKNVDATVLTIARAIESDVEACIDANADAVEIFAPLSDQHLQHALEKSRGEVLDRIEEAVTLARDGGLDVHLALVDAFRTDINHITAAFNRFPEVTYISLADTVGAKAPAQVEQFLTRLGENVDLDRAGVHFHDDMGVATANVFAAERAGVGRADVSVASLGERAGNPALEEVVTLGTTAYDLTFGIDLEKLIPACETVLEVLGEEVDPRKAILGDEVTKHESGIHTSAMLEEPSVFEPFDPSTFGGQRSLIFGEGTGRGAAAKLLKRAGVPVTESHVSTLLDRLADRGPIELDEAVAMAVSVGGEDA